MPKTKLAKPTEAPISLPVTETVPGTTDEKNVANPQSDIGAAVSAPPSQPQNDSKPKPVPKKPTDVKPSDATDDKNTSSGTQTSSNPKKLNITVTIPTEKVGDPIVPIPDPAASGQASSKAVSEDAHQKAKEKLLDSKSKSPKAAAPDSKEIKTDSTQSFSSLKVQQTALSKQLSTVIPAAQELFEAWLKDSHNPKLSADLGLLKKWKLIKNWNLKKTTVGFFKKATNENLRPYYKVNQVEKLVKFLKADDAKHNPIAKLNKIGAFLDKDVSHKHAFTRFIIRQIFGSKTLGIESDTYISTLFFLKAAEKNLGTDKFPSNLSFEVRLEFLKKILIDTRFGPKDQKQPEDNAQAARRCTIL